MYFIKEVAQVTINLPIFFVCYPLAYFVGRIARWSVEGFKDAY